MAMEIKVLINMSLDFGLPKSWKKAIINMIPKLESYTHNYLEYRPINLLSCLSKVSERVIKDKTVFFHRDRKK